MKHLLRSVITALLFFGSCLSGYNQSGLETTIHIKKLLMLIDDVGFSKVINPDSTQLEGSPFLNPEYINGTIITPEGEEFVEIPLRYNVFNDNFEFNREGQAYSLETAKFAKSVILDNMTFVYRSYRYKNREREGYLELLSGGLFNLYQRHRITFDPPQDALPYKDATPGKFKSLTPVLFLSYGSEEPQLIQNEKELIEIAKQGGVEIKPFLKEQRIKIRRKEDVIKVVEYINSSIR